ncbi:hypothetical protein EJ02DRAFT_422411 [Clathrospora elynae]|uniref:Uncharacterized protein n=1 Tax=Clathrospora elynae TaxID=706981 RepID=A0A6A5SR32_9PLEO|nr:hypothetical protein EJ02DRAFT_422411 [Clathrospora elynae]
MLWEPAPEAAGAAIERQSRSRSKSQSQLQIVTEITLDRLPKNLCDSYHSDRTDFRLESKTPCPHRNTVIQLRPPIVTSRHFESGSTTKKTLAVRRTPNFDSASTNKVVKHTPQKVSKKMIIPEYFMPHRWTPDHREFLCVLWRHYTRHTANFAENFNAAFCLELSMSKIRDQFEDYIRLHGAKAFPMYHEVFVAVTFEDPHGVYDEMRNMIELTAQDLGIELHRLDGEAMSPSGQAAKAKSMLTRNNYKSAR